MGSQYSRKFTVQIVKRPPLLLAPTGDLPAPLDITDRVLLDGLGSINRAVERDLLSFKTGDVTLLLDNRDGYFDNLFLLFQPTEQWLLLIHRGPTLQFCGVVISKGSVRFDRVDHNVEITAYGPSKALDVTSAAAIKRSPALASLTANALLGATTLTVNSTTDLLTGDTIHLTDHVNSEDVIVKQVLTATTVSLDVGTQHAYNSGSSAVCSTPYHRYKTLRFLVEALYNEAQIPLQEYRTQETQFKTLAPTPVNISGIDLTRNARRGFTIRNNKPSATLHGDGEWQQNAPDLGWVREAAPDDSGYYDWSPYWAQSDPTAPPQDGSAWAFGTWLREPDSGANAETLGNVQYTTRWGAGDHRAVVDYGGAGPLCTVWGYNTDNVSNPSLYRKTTAVGDGVTYSAGLDLGDLPGIAGVRIHRFSMGIEFDPVRKVLYLSYGSSISPFAQSWQLWRYTGVDAGTFTNIKVADDGTKGLFGPRYIADLDIVVALRAATGASIPNPGVGPAFEIAAYRDGVRLWVRPFPSCLVQSEVADTPGYWPTRTMRYVNGSLYCVVVSDGAVQLVRSDDEFQTYVMRKLAPATSVTVAMATRQYDKYWAHHYVGATARGYTVAAPFYAGVVAYADHEGISVGEALINLAVLTNAVPWLDDHLQGHFVARDLIPTGDVMAIDDKVLQRNSMKLWDEAAQYTNVTGPDGIDVVSGNDAFSSEGLEVNSPLIPNEAFAQALADALYAFYSRQRSSEEVLLHLDGTRIYRPMDRVTLGPSRFLVYESDHDLGNDEVTLTLLEDLA